MRENEIIERIVEKTVLPVQYVRARVPARHAVIVRGYAHSERERPDQAGLRVFIFSLCGCMLLPPTPPPKTETHTTASDRLIARHRRRERGQTAHTSPSLVFCCFRRQPSLDFSHFRHTPPSSDHGTSCQESARKFCAGSAVSCRNQ